MQEYSAQSNETLYKEFEEKILACNGEIERVVAQCNEAIVSPHTAAPSTAIAPAPSTSTANSLLNISPLSPVSLPLQSDRDEFETQLRQTEVLCAAYSEELEQAKIRLSQDDGLAREVSWHVLIYCVA